MINVIAGKRIGQLPDDEKTRELIVRHLDEIGTGKRTATDKLESLVLWHAGLPLHAVYVGRTLVTTFKW